LLLVLGVRRLGRLRAFVCGWRSRFFPKVWFLMAALGRCPDNLSQVTVLTNVFLGN